MGQRAKAREQQRRALARSRVIRHYEQVTNVSRTCRFFGISRSIFYHWLHRFGLWRLPLGIRYEMASRD